jgi:hypothetical protein
MTDEGRRDEPNEPWKLPQIHSPIRPVMRAKAGFLPPTHNDTKKDQKSSHPQISQKDADFRILNRRNLRIPSSFLGVSVSLW